MDGQVKRFSFNFGHHGAAFRKAQTRNALNGDCKISRSSAARANGFTLIELMIVVTVLALLTTTLSLSTNRPRATTASDHARFQAVHAQLREQAVMSHHVLGLRVNDEGYQRLRWDAGDWQALGDAVRWRGSVAVLLPFGQAAPLQFAPGGEVTPVRLRFDAGERAILCESGGWTEVKCGAG